MIRVVQLYPVSIDLAEPTGPSCRKYYEDVRNLANLDELDNLLPEHLKQLNVLRNASEFLDD